MDQWISEVRIGSYTSGFLRKPLTITEKYLLYSITRARRTQTGEHKNKLIIHIFLYLSPTVNIVWHATKSINTEDK